MTELKPGAAIGILVAVVLMSILSFMGRRRLLYREIVDFGRRPAYAVGAMTGAFLGTQIALTGLRQTKEDSTTMVVIERGVTIALIFSVTWLVVAFAKAGDIDLVEPVQARFKATQRLLQGCRVIPRARGRVEPHHEVGLGAHARHVVETTQRHAVRRERGDSDDSAHQSSLAEGMVTAWAGLPSGAPPWVPAATASTSSRPFRRHALSVWTAMSRHCRMLRRG